MGTHQKQSEIGWMYHSPAKPAADRPLVEYPPPSQIPGIGAETGSDAAHDEPKRRMLIKDTDTPYVRLAKQGGRENLLCIKENTAKKEPKGYPRNDWFYLEDNAAEDAAKGDTSQQEYQFLLPDYMVHHEHKKTGLHEDPKRLPYAYDTTTVYQREGTHATDKNVRVPEPKRDGYGVRSEKLKGKKEKYNMPKVERATAPPQEMAQPRPKYESPKANDTERPAMGKLLSYGYQKDWLDENEKVHHVHTKVDRITTKVEQTHITGDTQTDEPARHTSGKDRRSSGDVNTKKKAENGTKEPFKLSKFKNVKARTETHRHLESPPKADAPKMVPVASH